MLTREQILKVSRLGHQTGGFVGFDESNFDIRKESTLKGKHIIKLNLVEVELPNGDVAIEKR